MIANETLPIVSANVLGGGIQAVVVSTVLVIIFSGQSSHRVFCFFQYFFGWGGY